MNAIQIDDAIKTHLGGSHPETAGILIVDDEPMIRMLLCQLFKQEGVPIWTASCGAEAVDLYQRHREQISLVLLDVIMPRLDGPQTLQVLRELDPQVRCCFMTGNPFPYQFEDLWEMGALDVLSKPFGDLHALVRQLRELVEPVAV
jgi:CheY-like chemotaxis protein